MNELLTLFFWHDLLMVIAGACSGMMDRIQFHWDTVWIQLRLRDQFWNPEISWENKWKDIFVFNGKIDKDGNLTYDEKFPGSSTFFVFLTDGWHLLKFLMIWAVVISLVLTSREMVITEINDFWQVVILMLKYRLAFAIGFKLTYK